MRYNYDLAKKIEQRFDERTDIINDVRSNNAKVMIPDDVFASDGIKITLHTELKTMTMSGGKVPEDYTHTIVIDILGARMLIKNPWSIDVGANFMIFDEQHRIVFEVQTYDGRAPVGFYGGPTSIVAEKTVRVSGTSLTVSITDECSHIGIGRGDKVRIILDRE